jgi:hypothetical protein
MKSEPINKHEKSLLSESVSNALAYFLDLVHPRPKNPIQFVVIDRGYKEVPDLIYLAV